MPYHDSASDKDDRCNGRLMSRLRRRSAADHGKTFSDQMVDLIAYLEKYVIGHGKPTYEECALHFGLALELE